MTTVKKPFFTRVQVRWATTGNSRLGIKLGQQFFTDSSLLCILSKNSIAVEAPDANCQCI
jgi:hypothetical protein